MKSYKVELEDGRKFQVDTDEGDSQPSNYLSDVKANALAGLKEAPQGLLGAADTASKMAALTSPVEWGRSLYRGVTRPGEQTPLSEDIQAAGAAIRATGQGLLAGAKDVGNAAAMPFQVAVLGRTPAETPAGRAFRERPLSFTSNVATALLPAARLFKGSSAAKVAAKAAPATEAAAPVAKEAAEAAASELPSYLETKGAQGLNSIAGIRGNTIANMAGPGENPGVVGTRLAKVLGDEGAIGSTATETWQNANRIANRYGKAVDAALEKIKATNQKLGVYPELADPLKVEATPALKPIVDKANELAKSGYPADRAAARYWRAAYNSMAEKANNAGGFITLDDVRQELQKVGGLYNRAGVQNTGIVDELYGHLAGMREGMVNEIAATVGDQKLARDLLNANAGYSRYMRILPDISKAAASESVGQMNLGGIAAELKKAFLTGPTAAKSIMKVGRATKRLFSKGPQ